MDGKMKGLLKGLRYISQIFDNKEQEMQIGHPTDVKHVAHIGWDNGSIEPPSWMNEFRSPHLTGDQTQIAAQHKYSSSDLPGTLGSPKGEAPAGVTRRHSRRHASAGSLTIDSPSLDSSESRHGRRQRSSAGIGASAEPPVPENSVAGKQSRRRRAKGSSSSSVGGGSMRGSRSRAMAASSDPGVEDPRRDTAAPLTETREADGF